MVPRGLCWNSVLDGLGRVGRAAMDQAETPSLDEATQQDAEGELAVTPGMIAAGIRALHEAIGYDYNGCAADVVSLVFLAMAGRAPSAPPHRSRSPTTGA